MDRNAFDLCHTSNLVYGGGQSMREKCAGLAQWLPSCEMTRGGRCDAQYVRARIIADLYIGQEEVGKEKRLASESRHRIDTE